MLFATVNQVSANKCVARHDGYDDEADNEGMATDEVATTITPHKSGKSHQFVARICLG